MLSWRGVEAARAACRQLIGSIAPPGQIPGLSGRKQLAQRGCRSDSCLAAYLVVFRTVPSATRLSNSRHCSRDRMLQQLSICSNGAASALISWPFSGLGQRKYLGWPLYSSIPSQANRPGQSMAMACCSPCSSAGIRTDLPMEAMSLPSRQYLHPRRIHCLLQTVNARGHSTATAATARRQKNSNSSSRSQPSQQLAQSISSLNSDSTTSSLEDEELRTGEEGLTGLPWYYDEVVIKDNWAATDKEKEFWMAKAELFKRSTAVRAVAQLDPQWRFGVPYERLGGPIRQDDEGSRTRSSEDKAPSGSLWFRRAKTKDPFAVVLIKVGSFYESVGYDAALLMEHAGYNPMGGNTIPRAGCPDYKIQELLQLLVEEAGLSVAMWEEEPDTKEHGSVRREQRPRKFAQLVTPENPSYLYGLSSISQDRHAEAPNLKGIALTSMGCSVFVLNRYSDVVMVYQGISMDSLWSLLVSDGSTAPVVYLHWPLDQPNPSTGPTSSKHEQDFLKLKRSLQAGGARVTMYKSVDPLLGFEERVTDALRWPADKDIPHLPAWDAQNYWPGVRPLYHSTLMQLGLLSNPGVPSLADYLLPRSSNKVVRQVIRSLLVNPPPYDVAAATRRVVKNFGAGTAKPFSWDASGSITPQKVSLILSAGEGNDTFFQNMLFALGPVISTMDRSQSPALSGLVDDSWPLLCHTMGCQQQQITQDNVLQAAQQAFAAIEKVVVAAGLYNNSSSTDGSTDEEPEMSKSRRQKPALPEDSSAAVQQEVESFSAFMEVYKRRVQPDVVKKEYEEADIAFGVLWTVLDGLVHTLIKQAHQAGLDLAPEELPAVCVDGTNQSAWIKLPSAKLRTHMKDRPFQVSFCRDLDVAASERVYEVFPQQQVLHHPYDRNGHALKARDVFSCNKLDQALDSYRRAVAAANWAATTALQALSQRLSLIKLELSAAAQLGILLQSLYEHSAAAAAAGWSVPAVGLQEQLQSGVKFDEDSHQHGILELKGLQPYWMSRPRNTEERVCDDAPVCNDVELEGFMLLTGPNMAGKSTVLRSTAAAALCGSVGLAVPAAAGSLLPQLDAIMLRTFTGDAPSEELSAFGVEMNQMAGVLADVRPGSLVLIDELGKGTEVGSGTALASAMIKELGEMGARGIFATHLHGLMDLTHDTPGLTNFSMQVAEQRTAAGRTRLVPTWQLVPGPSTKSLALEVAKDMGLPDECIELAKKEYEKVKRLGGYKALIRIAAEAPVGEFEVEAEPSVEVNESVLSTEGDGIVVDSSSDSSGSGSNSSILRSISRRRRRRNSGSASSDVSNSDVKQQSQHERHQERVSQVVAIMSNLAAAGGRSRGLSRPPEQPTLAAAAAATEAVDDPTPDEAAGSASSAAAVLPEVHHLYRQGGLGPTGTRRTAGNQPPVAHLHAPVLYAAYFDRSGKWHAGESLKLAERWKSHTYRLGKQRVDMWYVVLDTTDGSIRSQLEGRLHLALDAAGVPLDSRRDAHRARRK